MQVKLGKSVLVCGTLPRDAEYRTVGERQTPLCKFGLKVDERETGEDQREAVWCNCTCWRKVAEVAAGFCKGDTVLAIGTVQERTYQNREGEDVVAKELVCEGVFLMGYPTGRSVPPDSVVPPIFAKNPAAFDFEEIVSDDDLPF